MIVYCHDGGVLGEGPTPADVMLIGIAPGRDEWTKTKKPFTGPSGKINNGLLKLIGLTREDVYVSNLLCWWKDEPTEEDIMRCLPRLLKEIEAVKPKLIVCLGKIVTEFLMADIESTNQKKFGSLQGGAFYSDTFGCWMLSTYHPAAYIKRGGSIAADIADGVRDYRKIPIYLKAPQNFGEVSYHVADSLTECNTVFEHFVQHDEEDIIALDIESYYDGSGMLSMAFACSHGVFHIPKHIVYGPNYIRLLDVKARWTFHNGQFDTQKIHEYLNIRLPIMEDTMLMSYSLDERGGGDTEIDAGGQERAVGIHGLKSLATEYCGAGFYANSGKHPEEMDPEMLALYNSSDAAYTYRLQRYFEPLQIADDVRAMYLELLVPAANSLRDANARGVYIDKEVMGELAREWIPQWLEKQEALQEDAKALGWPQEEINTNSPKQMSKLIYDIAGTPQVGYGKLVRSTSKPIIEELIRLHPNHPGTKWLQSVSEWRGLEKDLNVWIKGVEDHLDTKGFIHPEPLIHGTRNGRTSYHLVPVQTLPKARTVGESRARIRRMIHVSPPSTAGTGERLLLEADMRQAELWIAAFVSGDSQMLADLQSGDFHARVAESIWGKSKAECEPVEWEYRRDSAKRVTYGVLYNAGPDALITEKKLSGAGGSNYLFIETRQQAADVIEAFNLRYPDYAAWRENEKHTVQIDGEQVSRTGRKRRYYMIQDWNQLNQAVNTPIASFSHDFIFASLIEIPALLAEFDAWYLFEVHDSILFDIPKKYLHECVQIIEATMTKPRWGTPLGVPIDMKVGENWYDMISLDKYLEKESLAV